MRDDELRPPARRFARGMAPQPPDLRPASRRRDHRPLQRGPVRPHGAGGPHAGLPDRLQRLPPHRRGRPRHRLLRKDRDGTGRPSPRSRRWRPTSSGSLVDAIDMVMGDTALCPLDTGTFGSMSRASSARPSGRGGGSESRPRSTLAAEKPRVAAGKLGVEGRRRLRRRRPDEERHLRRARQRPEDRPHLDGKAVPKAVSDFEVMGKAGEAPRRARQGDRPGQVRGRHPPARHALREGPPPAGARRRARRASTRPRPGDAGVSSCEEGDMVAVLHPDPETRGEGAGLVKADWDVPKPRHSTTEPIFDHLLDAGGAGESRRDQAATSPRARKSRRALRDDAT